VSGQFNLRTRGMESAHDIIVDWRRRSAAAGRKWVIANDEPGGENIPLLHDDPGRRRDTAGVRPDVLDPGHDYPRRWFLWGSLLAGAAGIETYFGWDYTRYGGGDGAVSDYAAWDAWWDQCRHAHAFMTTALPLPHVDPLSVTGDPNHFCLGRIGQVYAVYRPGHATVTLDLREVAGRFRVRWFNPRTGGSLQPGSHPVLDGLNRGNLGRPPQYPDRDWIALVERSDAEP
jgi:hypothetical protein